MATTNTYPAEPTSPHAQAHLEPQGSAQPDVSNDQTLREINVGSSERIASVLGGSLVALFGMRRRSNFGALVAILGGGLVYRGMTGHCPAYSYLGKNTAQGRRARPEEFYDHGVRIEDMVAIDKPAEELYRFWRNFENLPRFMDHLESVKVIDNNRSHWVAKAPAGQHVEWDAEIINDVPNETIAWHSTENADVQSTGSVRFVKATDGQGTEVHFNFQYLPPAGELGRLVAKLFGEEPGQQVRDDLQRFKQHIEG